jgi:hypothetical protein
VGDEWKEKSPDFDKTLHFLIGTNVAIRGSRGIV